MSSPGVSRAGYPIAGYLMRADHIPSQPPYQCDDFPFEGKIVASSLQVELVNRSTGARESTITNSWGYFSFKTLERGRYDLIVDDFETYGAAVAKTIFFDPSVPRDPPDFVIGLSPGGGSYMLQSCLAPLTRCGGTDFTGQCIDDTTALWCENGNLAEAVCESACALPSKGGACSTF